MSLRALRGECCSLCVLCVLCGENLARFVQHLARNGLKSPPRAQRAVLPLEGDGGRGILAVRTLNDRSQEIPRRYAPSVTRKIVRKAGKILARTNVRAE